MAEHPAKLIERKVGGFWTEPRRNWCSYCGVFLQTDVPVEAPTRLSRDHIIPSKFQGRMTVPCCRSCNKAKGTKSLPEFMQTDYFAKVRERKLPNRASLRDLWLGMALAAVYRARALDACDPENPPRETR